MIGPSDLSIIGPFKDATIVQDIHKIACPCLILYGRDDELAGCAEIMGKRLKENAKSVTVHEFEKSSHFPHVEEQEDYIRKWSVSVVLQ